MNDRRASMNNDTPAAVRHAAGAVPKITLLIKRLKELVGALSPVSPIGFYQGYGDLKISSQR